ncbi:hypothetical protein, partial [Enhygromyxa salina]|uniref:hypothetical protein n=1 Tax=Enhygromyxa salina TaxID=215803 RepID=UPI0011B20DA5
MKISPLTSTTFLLAALTASAAGCKDVEPDGLYIWCDGSEVGLYSYNTLRGMQKPKFSLCLGPEHYSGAGETGGIGLESWTNDDEDIDLIRSMCQEQCLNDANGLGNCLQTDEVKWQLENYKQKAVPDPLGIIDDPEHLECPAPKDKRARNPAKTKVIPPTSTPKWPSTDQPLALS